MQEREQPSDEAAASSLTDLVLERLSRRNGRAADAAEIARAAPPETPAAAARALGGAVGSAAQAAGFLEGIAPGPAVSAAKPFEERPGELPQGVSGLSDLYLPPRCAALWSCI